MFSNLYKEPTISYSQKQKAKLQIIGHKSRGNSIIPQHIIKCMVLYKVYGAIMLCAICGCTKEIKMEME